MTTISDLRLITLPPTENQTIYAFNVDNPIEYYSESFFAKMGTTWAFCVVPDRIDNSQDYYVNIIQSDNQTISLNCIISDLTTEPELRAGILNTYNFNSADKYTYVIGYQNIRIYATAVLKERLNAEYKNIDIIQTDHQLILLVDSSNKSYSYSIELPVNSAWKAVLITEPGYTPGNMVLYNNDDEESEPVEYPPGEIISGFVGNNVTISATPATEIYHHSIMKPWLFDNSTTNYSNSDGYLQIGIGNETKKEIQTILLYTKNKITGESVQIGEDRDNLLYSAVGNSNHKKATRLIYRTPLQGKYILKSIDGYYDYEYILGYMLVMRNSSLVPREFSSVMTNITIKGFGFCTEATPVNDATKGYWFMIIDPPSTPNWIYIKIMMFDNNKKIFSMIAYKKYFEEISEGEFAGELIYTQDSKSGINDDAYLFLKNKFENNDFIDIGVYIF